MVGGFKNVKSKNLVPHGREVVRRVDSLSHFDLIAFVDHDLELRCEGGGVKVLTLKLSFLNVEAQR